MTFSLLGRMAISRGDFWSFITESVTRNPNLGIPALEDGLFAIYINIYTLICVSIFVSHVATQRANPY